MDFKIISLNTRGFSQSFRDFLFHNLLFEGDIFCFQEPKFLISLFFVLSPKNGEDHVSGRPPLVNRAAF